MESFKDLIAWQISMDLASAIYKTTKSMPKDEIYGLRAQIRGAAASVPANIAEGFGRNHTKEFIQSLGIAMGSLCEVETLYLLAVREEMMLPNEELEGLIVRSGQLIVKLRWSLSAKVSRTV